MRNIKIHIQLAKATVPQKSYNSETYVEEFLEDSGIFVSANRRICPKTFTPYIDGTILDEDKFSKYIEEHDYLNYEIVGQDNSIAKEF